MAIALSPVNLRIHGCAKVGRETMRIPSRTAPSPTTSQVLMPAEAMMMVIIVAMNRRWCPVRKT